MAWWDTVAWTRTVAAIAVVIAGLLLVASWSLVRPAADVADEWWCKWFAGCYAVVAAWLIFNGIHLAARTWPPRRRR